MEKKRGVTKTDMCRLTIFTAITEKGKKMNDLISRKAILKHIEKIRQGVQMMDDTHRASIIMNGMDMCEKAVRNQPSTQPSDEYDRGWKEGREALKEEMWEYVRDRLD